jgi:FMN phosphatase YigB (HAD superfamily)
MAEKAARLCELDPGLEPGVAAALVGQIEVACERVVDGGAQTTTETIAAIIDASGLDATRLDPVSVRRALSLPFRGRHELLEGASRMVRELREDGLALAVVSNTVFRDAECYREDFAAVGLDQVLSGILTSVDVGWRKPHPAIFEAALASTQVPPSRTAIVGNSERSDIIPGMDLGLTAIRVAIEEPPPVFSRADAVAVSLEDVPAIVRLS